MRKLLATLLAVGMGAVSLMGQQTNFNCIQGQAIQSFGTNGVANITEVSSTGIVDVLVDSEDNLFFASNINDDATSNDVLQLIGIGSDGSPLRNFGTNGRIIFPDMSEIDFNRASAALDADGNIYFATSFDNDETGTFNPRLVVAKMDSNGEFDMDFGVDGISLIDLGIDIEINDIKVSGSDLILAGSMEETETAVLLRVDMMGELDMDFGDAGTGLVEVDATTDEDDAFLDVQIDEDGNIYVLRQDNFVTGGVSVDYNLVVDRYDIDGMLDPDFGDDGTSMPFATIAGQSSEGRIVLTENNVFISTTSDNATTGGFDGQIASVMTVDGMLDPDFGDNGIVTNGSGRDDLQSYAGITVGMDGELYVLGNYDDLNGSNNRVFSLDAAGMLNTMFPEYQLNANPGGFGDMGSGLVTLSDGSIVAVQNTPNMNMATNDDINIFNICTGGVEPLMADFDQSAYIGIRSIGYDDASFVWSPGDGDGRVVFITEAGVDVYMPMQGEMIPDMDNSMASYMDMNASYGNSQLIYNGKGNMAMVTDLNSETEYMVTVYEYAEMDGQIIYNYEEAPGNPRTFMTTTLLEEDLSVVSTMSMDDKLFIDWEDANYVEGSVDYEVMLSEDMDGTMLAMGYDMPTNIGMMSEYEFAGLIADTDYYVWIRLADATSTSEWVTFGPFRSQAMEPMAPTFVSFDNRTTSEIDFTVSGMSDGFMVLAMDMEPMNLPMIMDGTVYTGADSDYSMASEPFGAMTGRHVYNGMGSMIEVEGLMMGQEYYFVVVPFNGAMGGINYGEPLFITHTTLDSEPASVSNVMAMRNGTDYEVTFDYTGEKVIVLSNDMMGSAAPMDGMGYMMSDMIDGEMITFMTDQDLDEGSATITISDFTVGQELNYTIYTYNGDVYEMATGNIGMEGSQNYDEGTDFSFTPMGVEPSEVTPEVTERMITSVEIDWSDDAMNATFAAEAYLVIVAEEGVTPTLPMDGMAYTNNMALGTSFDFGTYTPIDDNVSVVYNGTGTMTEIEGLMASTEYNVWVIPYTGSMGMSGQNYSSAPTAVTFKTFASQPDNVTNLRFTDRTQTSIELAWDNANMENVIVTRNTVMGNCDVALGFDPTVGDEVPNCNNDEVIYVGTGSTLNDMNLIAGTDYYYSVYTRNGEVYMDMNTYSYSTGADLEVMTLTNPAATQLVFKNVPSTITSRQDFTATVALRDQFNNSITAPANTTVTLVYNSNNVGMATMNAGDSVVTVTGNITSSPATSQTLSATATGLTAATSTINITAGEPSRVDDLSPVANRRDITVTWDIPADADGVVVFIRKGSATNQADPTDGTAITATAFDNNSTATQAIYVGSGETLSLTNLSFFTRYYFAVYTYTGSGSAINYNPAEVTNSAITRFKEGNIIPDAAYIGETFNITEPTPNPVSENITFELQNEDGQNAFDIRLVDVAGAEVAVYASGRTYSVAATSMNLPVPSQLANGIYYLHVTNGEHTMTKVIRLDR